MHIKFPFSTPQNFSFVVLIILLHQILKDILSFYLSVHFILGVTHQM